MTNPMQATEFFSQLTGKAAEMFSLWADANQKVLRELVDLSATTAKEGVRLYAEMQSGAVEAVKNGQAFLLRRQTDMQDAPKDPFACYQKNVLESVEGAQQAFKLLEGNAQALTRSAERLQVTTEQAAKEIQGTFAQLAGKVKSLYSAAA
jgi:nucleoid-associated protein YgaU